jgi:ubiquinone/menaquinone biosynthesis C-methylase UbiE
LSTDPNTMTFSELVGLLDEPNMCSGGFHTIHGILRAAPWLTRPGLRWLEVGSNTGFSCLELASLLDASITGVDIDPRSNDRARKKAAQLGLENVEFVDGDGENLDFADDAFDVVFCSNVTSFIADRKKAVDEYFRVTRPLGFVVAVPIYYLGEPPTDVRHAVESAIGTSLDIADLEGWKRLFADAGGVLVHEEAYRYVPQDARRIAEYANEVAAQPANAHLPESLRTAASSRLRDMYLLFDENLKFAAFSTLVFRNEMPTVWPILHETRHA